MPGGSPRDDRSTCSVVIRPRPGVDRDPGAPCGPGAGPRPGLLIPGPTMAGERVRGGSAPHWTPRGAVISAAGCQAGTSANPRPCAARGPCSRPRALVRSGWCGLARSTENHAQPPAGAGAHRRPDPLAPVGVALVWVEWCLDRPARSWPTVDGGLPCAFACRGSIRRVVVLAGILLARFGSSGVVVILGYLIVLRRGIGA
jgi:hypothetical protein